MEKPEQFGPLLTDTAPEDVPVIFSNRGLYIWLKTGRTEARSAVPASAAFIDALFTALIVPAGDPNKNISVPFSYFVQASSQKIRRLDLVHPRNQVDWCQFYSDYGGLISHYAKRSSASLRAPVKVSATRFVPNSAQDDRKLRLLRTEIDQAGKDHLHRHPTSYFAYSGHQLLYKFFQSEQYSRMEARYPVFWKLDISNCFGSIYTHSLAWGLSSKVHVKSNISSSDHTFAGRFDAVIRMANWNETNGIVVGSEFSRVFAELVLQSVDVEVERRRGQILANSSSNFRAFRYVDDYFLFASDELTADAFVRQLSEVLSDFKMTLNVSKMMRLRRPFATPQSVAIEHTRAIISDLWLQLVERQDGPEPEQEPDSPDEVEGEPPLDDDPAEAGVPQPGSASRRKVLQPRKIRNARRLKQSLIARLRAGAAGLDAGYAPVAGFAVQSLTSKVVRLCLDASQRPDDSGEYADAIAILLDICFFIYSVEPSVRNSVRIVNASLLAIALYKDHSRLEESANLQRLIYEGCVNFAENAAARSDGKPAQIEVLNLVSLLGQLTPDHEIPWSLLRAWVVGNTTGNVANAAGYFGMVVLLHYAADRPAYSEARAEIGAAIREYLRAFEPERARESSEYSHLLLDSLVCPHLDINIRKSILNDALDLLKITKPAGNREELLKWMSSQIFFTDWLDVSLERSLLRKSISRVY